MQKFTGKQRVVGLRQLYQKEELLLHLDNRINHIQERALRIISYDYKSSFTEMFNVKIGVAHDIMMEIFEIDN